ncbi:MAG: histidine--tRNA ligase [Acidobacteriota bacterium]
MSTKPPGGTRDFLPDEIRRREYVIGVIRDVYERYGFEPLETPAFENIETLLGKYGDEGNKLIFKILRRGEQEAGGGADLALRYDLTVPLARVIARYQNELPRFFKRYQIQPVWRADRPARGRFREFFQCDIDAIGTTSGLVEVELLAAVSDVLERLGFDDFTIRLNHRELLSGLLKAAGVPPPLHGEALVAIDKLDKIGADGVRAELAARGIDADAARICLELFEADFPAGLRRHLDGDERAALAVEQLETMTRLAERTAAFRHLHVDPSLARGLSYYTGAIMEIAVPDLAGSLGGGGRYDNLIGMFLGRPVPACGFSLGLERIIVVMTERKMFPAGIARAAVDVMVAIWNDDTAGHSLALAFELRRLGLRVDVYPEAEKIGKQFKYAAARGVPFVALLGDDERARGEVAIKDLRSGDQQSIARGEVAAFITRQLPQDA